MAEPWLKSLRKLLDEEFNVRSLCVFSSASRRLITQAQLSCLCGVLCEQKPISPYSFYVTGGAAESIDAGAS